MTSSFKIAGTHPKAVAISRGVPAWYRGRRLLELAPPRWMLATEDDDEFIDAYGGLLAALDANVIAKQLGDDAVLLCWEQWLLPEQRNPRLCHRFQVAEWLQRAGFVCVEFEPCSLQLDLFR